MSEPPPEHLFEIAQNSLVAVSPRDVSQRKQEVWSEPVLVASPSAPNVVKPAVFREVLPKLTGRGAGKRNRTAIVIPDYAVRMAVLDFESFPASESERVSLLRFRLRKSVPFPIDEAQLAYSIQLEEKDRVEVLVVAIAKPILQEYEQIFTDAGYQVGLVMPSCLAALPLCSSAGNGLTMAAKLASETLSVLLLEKARVRLVRCIDLASVAEGEAQSITGSVLPLLQQTVAYAEDQIGQPVVRLMLCGFGSDTELVGRSAEKNFSIPYTAVRSKFGVASSESAAVLGLLEQYAA